MIVPAASYLNFIRKAYDDRGGIEGQRAPLKTKTAIKIRGRMVDDLLHGAVLPPIVIGVVPTSSDEADKLKNEAVNGNIQALVDRLLAVAPAQVAIIDGMQRTTALLEASDKDATRMASHDVRLELWIGENANSLIYRMLVLNSGQVPWDIKRQLETVYTFLLNEIRQRVADVAVYKIEDRNRRTSSGEYQSSIIIEGYFAFTSRKPFVDVKERVAEDFARLDATESAADGTNLERFIEVLRLLAELDKAFSRYAVARGAANEGNARFLEGRDVFSTRAAIIGFVSAAAVSIYGEPGFELDPVQIAANSIDVTNSVMGLITLLDAKMPEEVGTFLELEVLEERLQGRTGGVGDYEREAFYRAFLSLIKHGKGLPSLLPCWRA
jgi:hypothetical protein